MATSAVLAPSSIVPVESDRWLSGREAGAYLGLTGDTMKTYREKQIGPPYARFNGRVIRYRLSDLIQFCLDNQERD